MLFVFNKDKIISYIIAMSIVAFLFIFSIAFVPDKDVELVKASSNVINNTISVENDINNTGKYWKIKQKAEKITFYVDKTKKR